MKSVKRGLQLDTPTLPGHRVVALPAPWGRRILAFLIDLIILNIFVTGSFQNVIRKLLPADASYHTIQSALENQPALATAIFFVALLSGIFAVLYFSILESQLGYTVGKLFMQIRVAPLYHEPLTFWKCMVRSLMMIPVFPFIILWIADPLYALFSPLRQRLLEQWSKTMTVSYVVV
ncbi:MAG: RDD family protein [Candidatus Woesearchaeota archaeon]|nr:RDD family protein [Candidatus Woesearchaeota archaeon]